MAAPDPGHLVEHGLRGVRVLKHVPHREIRYDVGVHEDRKGERHEPELQQCRRSPQIHQRSAAHGRPDQRRGPLHERYEKREHESEMANFY